MTFEELQGWLRSRESQIAGEAYEKPLLMGDDLLAGW